MTTALLREFTRKAVVKLNHKIIPVNILTYVHTYRNRKWIEITISIYIFKTKQKGKLSKETLYYLMKNSERYFVKIR